MRIPDQIHISSSFAMVVRNPCKSPCPGLVSIFRSAHCALQSSPWQSSYPPGMYSRQLQSLFDLAMCCLNCHGLLIQSSCRSENNLKIASQHEFYYMSAAYVCKGLWRIRTKLPTTLLLFIWPKQFFLIAGCLGQKTYQLSALLQRHPVAEPEGVRIDYPAKQVWKSEPTATRKLVTYSELSNISICLSNGATKHLVLLALCSFLGITLATSNAKLLPFGVEMLNLICSAIVVQGLGAFRRRGRRATFGIWVGRGGGGAGVLTCATREYHVICKVFLLLRF